jgi:hypothetical protein
MHHTKRKIAITEIERTTIAAALMQYGFPSLAVAINARFDAAACAEDDGPEVGILASKAPTP